MTASRPTSDEIRAAFTPHGLFLRGVVNFAEGDAAPSLADGRSAAGVALIGIVGRSAWRHFRQWQAEAPGQGGRDPLDTWSKAVIGPIAAQMGATAYFPSDPPWQPFQQWAMRAEGLRPSPLGILIHPTFGLWHSYRGALGFSHAVAAAEPAGRFSDSPAGLPDEAVPARGSDGRHAGDTGSGAGATSSAALHGPHPCDFCRDRPCLPACPVSAVTAAGFDLSVCRGHLRTPAGRSGCMAVGCLARNACPVGADYRYGDDQLCFHMAALSL